MKTPVSINLLDQIEIATPCTASWEEMAGDDRTRYCSHCSLNVYNLSGMTRDEATRLVTGAEGRVCVRLYRREDGTILTQDCPTGLRAARRRLLRSVRNIAATTATLLAGVIGLGGRQASAQPRHMMGGIARQECTVPKEETARDTVDREVVKPESVDTSIVKPERDEPEIAFEMGEVMITSRDSATPAPADPAIEGPVDPAEESPIETATEAPIETATEAPIETATEDPIETATEAPVDEPVCSPGETPTEATDRPRIM